MVILFAVASIGAESIFVGSRMLRTLSHQRLMPEWVAAVDARGRPRWAIAITCAGAVALTYCNLSAGGITVFTWLSYIASTGFFVVWIVVAVTSFRFRAALKAQGDALFSEPYAWPCSFWPWPPAWLLLCCSFYTGCAVYLALYPVVSRRSHPLRLRDKLERSVRGPSNNGYFQGSDTPSAYSFFQSLIGLIIIVFSGIGYKIIFRTKLRDPSTADLHTGRRPLSTEEIIALDEYRGLPLRRRVLSFVQLW